MTCACSSNKQQLALFFGQDARQDLPEQIKRSLANCPKCRAHFTELKQASRAIEVARAESTPQLKESLWPVLVNRLPTPRVAGDFRRERRPQWKDRIVPVFSVAAACVAVLVVIADRQFSRTGPVYETTTISDTIQSTEPANEQLDVDRFADTEMSEELKLFSDSLRKWDALRKERLFENETPWTGENDVKHGDAFISPVFDLKPQQRSK